MFGSKTGQSHIAKVVQKFSSKTIKIVNQIWQLLTSFLVCFCVIFVRHCSRFSEEKTKIVVGRGKEYIAKVIGLLKVPELSVYFNFCDNW